MGGVKVLFKLRQGASRGKEGPWEVALVAETMDQVGKKRANSALRWAKRGPIWHRGGDWGLCGLLVRASRGQEGPWGGCLGS